jgi:hypothetical protein
VPDVPSVQLAALFGLALLAGAVASERRRIAWPLAGAALGALVAALYVGLHAPPQPGASPLPTDSSRLADGDYTSSRACRSCHPGEHASWLQSYHRRMTRPATPDGVLGAFDGRTLTFHGRTYRVWREGDRFLVDMPAFGTEGRGDDLAQPAGLLARDAAGGVVRRGGRARGVRGALRLLPR